MFLSISFISRIFLKRNRFWFRNKMMQKYRLTSERNGRKDARYNKTIINTIYVKPDFSVIKKMSENCNVSVP